MQVDVARQLDAIVREVGTRELDGKLAKVVLAARSYDGEIAEVWDALTSAERIPRWFLPVTGELKLGGRYQLEGNAGGTITACEPPRRLELTWEFGGSVSWVSVQLLEEAAERTRLELEHVAHVDDEFWFQYGPGATGVGWDLSILGLALYLSGDMLGGASEGTAWSMSGEGKGFTRGSSEAWRVATVAANAMTREEADAAAARTTAFYLGEGQTLHAFDVLGDPVRRRILELLAEGEHASGDIVTVVQAEFGISQPAVSQHLKVLREAGFATVRPEGARRVYAMDAAPLAEVDAWLGRFRSFWTPRLEALATEVARGRRRRAQDSSDD